jgi:PAS domain S-box-containing protein
VKWRLRFDRLNLKLGLIVSTLVVGALGIGFTVAYGSYSRRLLEVTREQALLQSSLIRSGLEHGMLENDQHLVNRMVAEYANRPLVQRVMVLDRRGDVQVSSDPAIAGRHFSFDDPTCQVCHHLDPRARSSTVVLTLPEGDLLRSVEPILNRAPCHRCHDPEHRINGVLIIDVPLGPARGEVARTTRLVAVGTGAICLALLGGIGLAFRRLVLRRLVRFERTARAIAGGDLARRVPVEGNDSLTELETQFNQMADSVGGLLETLSTQRAHLENVMNSVDDGMVVLDESRRVVAVNDAFRRRLGPDVEPLACCCCADAGWPHADLCPEEGQSASCRILTCLRTGRVELAVHTRTDAAGNVHHEEVRSSPVRDSAGHVTHVVEVWRDITDRRSAEARLADYQRMASLGMLASGFSHEVNTPLASIGTCIEGIERILAEPVDEDVERREEAQEYARIALTQVQRCGAITRQFLQLARGQALTEGVVDLHAAAASVTRLALPTAKQAGIAIAVDEADDLPSVIANAPATQQVLLNLVLNAVEASGPGQTVRLGFEAEDEIAVFVHDSGVGIPAEDLPRVFEPFFSRSKQGTGLGLFVSLNLARRWGGDIRVESTRSSGTTFWVTFPRPRVGDGRSREGSEDPDRG